jgi:heat shock protein HslJ
MRTLIWSALLLVAAGCQAATPSVELDGDWRLVSGSVRGTLIALVPEAQITMRIDGGEIGGTSACNHYGGQIADDGGEITIGALTMTEMACADEIMNAEAAYLDGLGLVTGAAGGTDELVLSGDGVELRFERADR